MISIIIPARNEEAHLGATLTYLRQHAPHPFAEIIVAEGGSADATAGVARHWATVVHGHDSTRAALMNAGARVARGDVFFFLHADSVPPPDFLTLIRTALADPRVGGGAFDHQFSEPVFGLWLVSTIDRIRFRLTKNYYGDQGIFVRRAVFDQIGGFPDRAILEDLEFSSRMKRLGRTVLIPRPVRTSGRRFLNGGITRTFLRIVWLLALYTLRIDTERYAASYRKENDRRGAPCKDGITG
ncbi:MAG TPA: TIGR04283 family arsenosugar biosynthesis glycosyltransferase [Candidatus Methylomirabilis sp.]|nr:TIGR04283 family arsenosugar biosynthesis glycosyltransferase [Candidatus Methylomirabilis sp.]